MGVLGEAQAYKLKSSVWKPARFNEGSEALRWILGSERANSSIEAKIWVKATGEGDMSRWTRLLPTTWHSEDVLVGSGHLTQR